MSLDNDRLMIGLAAILAKSPNATYLEIAERIGVSRATLYRFCGNREELIHRILKYAATKLTENIQAIRLEDGHPIEALNRLLESELKDRPLHSFLSEFWSSSHELNSELLPTVLTYEKVLDNFFLRGQREGVFRIDIPAAVLNENLTWLLIGLMDAERRGRIARASVLETAKLLFLEGAEPH
ncbi:TetR/AcrR family transcriptional regulator [Yersinia canariae]|nr:TetR/AcrR family transcriptional regulator [Yersinia canariae]